ncbi:MAG: PHP domain-containing protein [Burkholderiales bacterium]|nr:PHP domain-containing protein [Burkholderiales bacterium]
MMSQSKVVPDLHMHSIFSDGRFTPEELVGMAVKNGVNLVSLTDHDEVAGNKRMKAAAEKAGIDCVTGIEISSGWASKEIHVVGLDFDEDYPPLLEFVKTVQHNRAERAKKIAEKLEDLGYHGAYEGAMQYVTNPKLMSRTHFAAWLYNSGKVKSWQEAFNELLGSGKPAYVKLESISIPDSVKLIKEASGIPVLAHPGRYNLEGWKLQALLDDFKSAGGNVIEVTTGSHRPEDVPVFTRIAREQNFEVSSGSDFHRLDIRCEIGKQGELPEDLPPVWKRFKHPIT